MEGNIPSSVTKKSGDVEPRRLELSINPEDGSLQTMQLSRILLAATDGLYSDLYNMAHGELEVATAVEQQQQQDDQQHTAVTAQRKTDRMTNLSFAQRRHELSWRLSMHSKGLAHVAALTAASASSNFASAVQSSTKALKHARTAWVLADEAQDALYFFHAQLFAARQPPHDVYGALECLKQGRWTDLPKDILLRIDRFVDSKEGSWSSTELKDRWCMAVRDKLVRGEVGWNRRQLLMQEEKLYPPPLWKVTLHGGVVHLTHGASKLMGSQTVYPIEAHLTVLSTDEENPQWTLLSIEARVQAKTGESNHQLDTTMRQRFNLHKLGAMAMIKEEQRWKKQLEDPSKEMDEGEKDKAHPPPAPLDCLFQVAHAFALSWQLEILSAQAQALRRGTWATTGHSSTSLTVTPVQFFDEGPCLGFISISFWSVDDSYGPPAMGDLQEDSPHTNGDSVKLPSTSQFVLLVRAIAKLGMRVTLSGASVISRSSSHVQTTVSKLVEATSDPFSLSASNALLAATMLCAEQKCQGMVSALLADQKLLPPWMSISVERGSIAIAAEIGFGLPESAAKTESIVLFRLSCDARTGNMVTTFDRSFPLLQRLASNSMNSGNDTIALRSARTGQRSRRARGGQGSPSGRMVKDTFESVNRSMSVLGYRTGVGSWNDSNDRSAQLRQRTTQHACQDVRLALINGCSVAALYGLAALTLGVATGVSAMTDAAGGPLPQQADGQNGSASVASPPVSIVLDQQLIQREVRGTDETKTEALLQQDLFGIVCSADNESLRLQGVNVTVVTSAPFSLPERKSFELVSLPSSQNKEATMLSPSPMNGSGDQPPLKKTKHQNGSKVVATTTKSALMSTVEKLAASISEILNSK